MVERCNIAVPFILPSHHTLLDLCRRTLCRWTFSGSSNRRDYATIGSAIVLDNNEYQWTITPTECCVPSRPDSKKVLYFLTVPSARLYNALRHQYIFARLIPPSHRLPLDLFCWEFPRSLHLRSDRNCFSEDYATIDNAVVFDDDYEDASCTSAATAVPAGWRLADWNASIGLVSDFASWFRGA